MVSVVPDDRFEASEGSCTCSSFRRGGDGSAITSVSSDAPASPDSSLEPCCSSFFFAPSVFCFLSFCFFNCSNYDKNESARTVAQ